MHTPNTLSTSLGIIGGLVLGDLAIKAGWFVTECVLCMAAVGIGMFATPSIEFAMGIRIFRLFLLIATGIFGLWGFLIANIIVMAIILKTYT